MTGDATPTATSSTRLHATSKTCSGLFRLISSTRLEVMVRKSQARPCGLTCMATTPSKVVAARKRQSAN